MFEISFAREFFAENKSPSKFAFHWRAVCLESATSDRKRRGDWQRMRRVNIRNLLRTGWP
jgi:DNA polymerase III delta prime subunit